MKFVRNFALFSFVSLLLFLVLRPVVGRLGDPESPEIRGHARVVAQERLPRLEDLVKLPDRKVLDPTPTPTSQPAATMAEIEEEVFQLTNEMRVGKGQAPLQTDETLREAARLHCLDMSQRRFFEHVNPDGRGPSDRIATLHRTMIGICGENIWMEVGDVATDSATKAGQILKSWMESPGHRANILRQEFTHLGVGVIRVGDTLWATQNFGGVTAFLSSRLPAEVHFGAMLPLDHRTLKSGEPNATRFDFWSSDGGYAVSESQSVDSPIDHVAPGIYRLRFYFPTSRGGEFSVITGPEVEVAQP